MAVRSKTRSTDSRLFMLALGLLVGFVIGFVMLLSRLPVDSGSGSRFAGLDKLSLSNLDFDYYAHLPEQKAARKILAAKMPAPEKESLPVPPQVTQQAQPAASTATNAVNPATAALKPTQQTQAVQTQTSPAGQAKYFLQAGNYRQAEQAERARAVVMMLGLDAFIVVRQDASGSFGHRVRVGPFFEQTRLLEARDRLRDDGIPYQMIRVKS